MIKWYAPKYVNLFILDHPEWVQNAGADKRNWSFDGVNIDWGTGSGQDKQPSHPHLSAQVKENKKWMALTKYDPGLLWGLEVSLLALLMMNYIIITYLLLVR